MKKKIMLISIIILMFSFINCGNKTVPVKRSGVTNQSGDILVSSVDVEKKSTGWVDNNTLLIKTTGAPNPGAKGFIKRRGQAKRAAILQAQKDAIALLGKKVTEGVLVSKDVEMIAKNGQVISETYDDKNHCTLIYKIRIRKNQ